MPASAWMTARAGVEAAVRSGLIHAHEHGCELNIWHGRKRLWLQISLGDADVNYLMAENMTFFLWRDVKLFRAFLADLQDVLQADHRFSRIRWFRKGGIGADTASATGPFDDLSESDGVSPQRSQCPGDSASSVMRNLGE